MEAAPPTLKRLHAVLPKDSLSVLYCDHIEEAGEKLFTLACKRDLEGIVAKHKFGPYLQDAAKWFKIRNRKYSQWAGREKFFEREREVDPDLTVWDQCALVCEETMTMCQLLQFRNVEDQWGEICGRISVDGCGDCGASVCEQHAERCRICPVTLCPSCMGLHAKQHRAKTPQRVPASPDRAVANESRARGRS